MQLFAPPHPHTETAPFHPGSVPVFIQHIVLSDDYYPDAILWLGVNTRVEPSDWIQTGICFVGFSCCLLYTKLAAIYSRWTL